MWTHIILGFPSRCPCVGSRAKESSSATELKYLLSKSIHIYYGTPGTPVSPSKKEGYSSSIMFNKKLKEWNSKKLEAECSHFLFWRAKKSGEKFGISLPTFSRHSIGRWFLPQMRTGFTLHVLRRLRSGIQSATINQLPFSHLYELDPSKMDPTWPVNSSFEKKP